MALCIQTSTDWQDLNTFTAPSPADALRKRIAKALGTDYDGDMTVDDETLSRYYRYLSANLRFPFTAFYPIPKWASEPVVQRCVVLELLDPAKFVTDGFDGLFCRTRKGQYEVHRPLIDLELPHHSRNFQLIEDYWMWFSRWR